MGAQGRFHLRIIVIIIHIVIPMVDTDIYKNTQSHA